MDQAGAREGWVSALRGLSLIPLVLVAAGGVLILTALSQVALAIVDGSSVLVALLDLILVGVPGGTLMYTGYWMPRSDITWEYYPRIIAWIVGGVLVMFGFIVLRDLHPGVTAEWSVGTQAIALMIGSLGGLLIGVEETRAMIRTKQLEARTRELVDRERQLTRQNERLEQFADVVSHDLRNPLNVATGRLELAQETCDSDHLDHVDRAHDRMEALIEDLLALAREGDAVTDREPVDLASLARTCWTNVDTRGATLVVDVDRTVRADESRAKQLLENLIRNAVEHGGPGVTVTVGDLADGFYVEDTGPGIPEDDRPEVFDTGFSTSRDGTGFGLSIVERVVEAHGWTVRVTAGSDVGARFEITGVEWATTSR